MLKIITLINLAIFLWVSSDTILLKNGTEIKGQIVKEIDNAFIIETSKGKIVVTKDQIKKTKQTNSIRSDKSSNGENKTSDTKYFLGEVINSGAVSNDIIAEVFKKKKKQFLKSIVKAEDLLQQKKYWEAIGLFEILKAEYNEPPFDEILSIKLSEAYSAQTMVYVKSKEYGKAKGAIRRALGYNPYSSNAHLSFGILLIETNDRYDIAKKEFRLALNYNPSNKLAGFYANLLKNVEKPDDEYPTLELMPKFSEESLESELKTAMAIYEKKSGGASSSTIEREFTDDKKKLALLLAGYNAGPTAVMTYRGEVPYPETVNYIKRVLYYLDNPPQNGKYSDIIENKSVKYNLDPRLIHAIIKVESDFNPDDMTHNWAGGARGLIQLVKEDWNDTIKRMNVNWKYETYVFDPDKNLEVGCHYLNWLTKTHLPNWINGIFE